MIIKYTAPLRGELTIPGDKSISHRSIMFGALAQGTTEVSNFLTGADCLSTISCFRQMGIDVEQKKEHVLIHGNGLHGLNAPSDLLDAGNSGTTVRLLSGILAGQSFDSAITGDDSIQKRPMKRIMAPLLGMDADISSVRGNGCAPLQIHGKKLHGTHYDSPVASAQVKSCILLAGLYADGITSVTEPALSRNHSELMLRYFGADVRTEYKQSDTFEHSPVDSLAVNERITATPSSLNERITANPASLNEHTMFEAMSSKTRDAGSLSSTERKRMLPTVSITPDPYLVGQKINVPGDISSAAYFIAAALLVPGSELLLKNVGINPTRDGMLRVCKAMGADITLINEDHTGAEPSADLLVHSSHLKATTIEGDLIPALIDELPILAVLAAFAEGTTIIRDAAELRVKESDRIAVMTDNLSRIGCPVEATEDGMVITGGKSLHGAVIDSHKDHRVAMSFSVAALACAGEMDIRDAECVAISYPGFYEDLKTVCKK
ncbi:MAG: 3-phosphoshikimate 1-carboxyvinyltransferase [Lachnospiraceae bacterium]|nr:3-phosphoshikimate 1-carboxyvinyltransferase [Lachnospiraceae bacterium]